MRIIQKRNISLLYDAAIIAIKDRVSPVFNIWMNVRYDITSLRLLNENGGELSFVPNGGFIAEVCFNKAGDDGTKDTLIMAAYDPDGNLIYTDSVTAYFAEAYDHKFAFYVPAIYNNIDTIKVFVWDSFDSMIPMSDQEVKSNAVVS